MMGGRMDALADCNTLQTPYVQRQGCGCAVFVDRQLLAHMADRKGFVCSRHSVRYHEPGHQSVRGSAQTSGEGSAAVNRAGKEPENSVRGRTSSGNITAPHRSTLVQLAAKYTGAQGGNAIRQRFFT